MGLGMSNLIKKELSKHESKPDPEISIENKALSAVQTKLKNLFGPKKIEEKSSPHTAPNQSDDQEKDILDSIVKPMTFMDLQALSSLNLIKKF